LYTAVDISFCSETAIIVYLTELSSKHRQNSKISSSKMSILLFIKNIGLAGVFCLFKRHLHFIQVVAIKNRSL
jgi:hypothetical protein